MCGVVVLLRVVLSDSAEHSGRGRPFDSRQSEKQRERKAAKREKKRFRVESDDSGPTRGHMSIDWGTRSLWWAAWTCFADGSGQDLNFPEDSLVPNYLSDPLKSSASCVANSPPDFTITHFLVVLANDLS